MCHLQTPVNTTTTTMCETAVALELKKTVRFGAVQKCFLEPLPTDLQREHLYYSAEELAFQKQTDIQAKRNFVDAGLELDANDHSMTFRGLEHVLNKRERRRRISKHVKGVLEVQKEQKESGLIGMDDYELFVVSRAQSKDNRKAAQKMAARDAQDAAMVMDEEEELDVSVTETSVSESSSASAFSASRRSRRRGSKKTIKRCVSGFFRKLGAPQQQKGIQRCKTL
ncbi:expressed unknown protein [Seminavis robusta]|uniref:Uncharacterized protein n=1 Tax=Seminavis robusta TaxID=568900 RepID=A0A9N8ENY5_9STRA|nr:expressed unknown protein [Seminavis robusta]|eukprot:Sro1457_g274350.1 n/a (226) ;mRNA; f:14008-14685